jgi:hypothetical protein
MVAARFAVPPPVKRDDERNLLLTTMTIGPTLGSDVLRELAELIAQHPGAAGVRVVLGELPLPTDGGVLVAEVSPDGTAIAVHQSSLGEAGTTATLLGSQLIDPALEPRIPRMACGGCAGGGSFHSYGEEDPDPKPGVGPRPDVARG